MHQSIMKINLFYLIYSLLCINMQLFTRKFIPILTLGLIFDFVAELVIDFWTTV